ncbi:M23 family metallopeptidase [Rhodococcus sp. X156]|uniref:M23 family metallopeptidase n=1 Tax=Rhodococcus sp. X156 TaxID=2499145 RepID=UPI001F4973CF|nr:M23 family metallopeptidase [Rhodococcus sp. X156]
MSLLPTPTRPRRWIARGALAVAASTIALTAAPAMASAQAPAPAPVPLVEQGAQLLQTINSAVATAASDPTLDLVFCLFNEVTVQVENLVGGRFDVFTAADGFTSCFEAFADAGNPEADVPGSGGTVGGNNPGQPTTAAYVAPAKGTYTSGFGERWGSWHYGIDIANKIGTPIVAAHAGKVISAGPASGFGLWVRIQHTDGTITTYGHNDSNKVRVGDVVKVNDVIAYIGNRGDSTGPHLHFEVRLPNGTRVDPAQWLRARGVRI